MRRIFVSSMNYKFSVRITPSYLPVRPWNAASDSCIPACFEIQSFEDVVTEPHTNFFNLLYVYPLSLKYDGQKTFSKARNIVCTVRFISASGGDKSKASSRKNLCASISREFHTLSFSIFCLRCLSILV